MQILKREDGTLILGTDAAAVAKASQAYLEKLLEQIKPLVDEGTWAKIHGLAMAHAGGVATGQKRAAEREAAAQAAAESGMALSALVAKAYPSEHAARIVEPEAFAPESFRRKEITPGVAAIFGHLKGETAMTLQTYRFDAEKFTPAQAEKWLQDHDVKPLQFEPAKVEKALHVVRICKTADEQRMVYGVAIEPDVKDLHGEVISEETCRQAAHDYMRDHGGINVEHPGLDGYNPHVDAVVVESVIMPCDVADWHGSPVRKGAWVVGIHVPSEAVWKSAKAGKFGGLSIEGTALRVPAETRRRR